MNRGRLGGILTLPLLVVATAMPLPWTQVLGHAIVGGAIGAVGVVLTLGLNKSDPTNQKPGIIIGGVLATMAVFTFGPSTACWVVSVMAVGLGTTATPALVRASVVVLLILAGTSPNRSGLVPAISEDWAYLAVGLVVAGLRVFDRVLLDYGSSRSGRRKPAGMAPAYLMIGVSLILTLALAPRIGGGDGVVTADDFGIGTKGGPTFANHPGLSGVLDAGDTPNLSVGKDGETAVVLRVKAARADYWRGAVYDRYDGRYWRTSSRSSDYLISDGWTELRPDAGDGEQLTQYFLLERAGLDVYLGAEEVSRIAVPGGRVSWDEANAVIAPAEPLLAGATWVAQSTVSDATADELRQADPRGLVLSPIYLDTSQVSPETAALAREITASSTNTYDVVVALEEWFDTNVEYLITAPPVPEGIDPVDSLLFDTRVGYCEPIASSMVMMLRSLGIPARIAVGFVPSEFDSDTGTWISRAADAHAWAEVYFPGHGWRGFDPTAGVARASDDPGLGQQSAAPPVGGSDSAVPELGELVSDDTIGQIWKPLVGLMGLLALAGMAIRFRPRRIDPFERMASLGRRHEIEWTSTTSLRERLDDLTEAGFDADQVSQIARRLDHLVYAGDDSGRDESEIHAMVDQLERAAP